MACASEQGTDAPRSNRCTLSSASGAGTSIATAGLDGKTIRDGP
jgi:hypothetical protein